MQPRRFALIGHTHDIDDLTGLDSIDSDLTINAGFHLHLGTEEIMVVNGATIHGQLEINSDTAAIEEIHTHSATNNSVLYFARSRGTNAAPTIVAADDYLGAFYATGFDGTDYALSAGIQFAVDGTPGTDDMPGRIVFAVSPDGSHSLAEALRITSTKHVDMRNDSAELRIGASQDLRLYHDGTNSLIDNDTGALILDSVGTTIFKESGTTVATFDLSGVNRTLTLGDGTNAVILDIDGASANARVIRFKTGGLSRWDFRANVTAESGANAGSNFDFNRYDDAGLSIGTGFRIIRSSGQIQLGGTATDVSAPVLSTGDTDTGIYWPAANTLGLVVGGAEIIRFAAQVATLTGAAQPEYRMVESDAGADETTWGVLGSSGDLTFVTRTDALVLGSTAFQLVRTGTTPIAARFPIDNMEVRLGVGDDLRLYHDGTNSYIENNTGQFILKPALNLIISDTSTAGASLGTPTKFVSLVHNVDGAKLTYEIYIPEGTNNRRVAYFLDDTAGTFGFDCSATSLVANFEIQRVTTAIFRINTLSATLPHVDLLLDNQQLRIGAGQDLTLYHDGTNSFLDNNTGSLRIQSASTIDIEQSVRLNMAQPILYFYESDQAVDGKYWRLQSQAGTFQLHTFDDALTTAKAALSFARSANAVTTMNFGNATDNPAYSFLGTGTTAFGGALSATGNINISNDTGLVRLGASADLTLTHDGTNSIIANATGDLNITTSGGNGDLNVDGISIYPEVGTFTGTFTGGTTSPTVTVRYSRIGKLVILYVPANSFTSNATTYTMTGAPASIRPDTSVTGVMAIHSDTNNSVAEYGQAGVAMETTGTLTFYRQGSATGWTNANTKAHGAFVVAYSIENT